MSCDLREMESSPQKDKKYTILYFCFLISVYSNTVWLFLICPKPFSPLLDHFWVLICIENFFVEYGIFFTFEFLRFMYTIWLLKASDLDFITLNANNLAK